MIEAPDCYTIATIAVYSSMKNNYINSERTVLKKNNVINVDLNPRTMACEDKIVAVIYLSIAIT